MEFAARGCACRALLDQDEDDIAEDKRESADALLAALMGKLPDSVFMNISKTASVPKDVMDAMKVRFGQTTAISEANAQRRLFSLRCENEKKMQQHLDKIISLKEEIAETGVTLDDKIFADAIIASIPSSYQSIVQSYEASIRIQNITTPLAQPRTIKSDEIIRLLRAEAQSRASASRSDRPSGRKDTKEEVAASAQATRGAKRGGGRARGSNRKSGKDNERSDDNITCFKCSGKGHRADVCPSAKRASPKDKDSAHAAQSSTSDAKDGKKNSATSGKTTSEGPSAKVVIHDEGWNVTVDQSIDEALHTPYSTMVEIYDSGVTTHMTPHRHLLINYHDIPERMVNAAGKSSFAARGMGDMYVTAYKGDVTVRYRLKDVLYAPDMTATLVSIGRFDDAGLKMQFGDGVCHVMRRGEVLFTVPKVRGLYRVFHDSDAAYVDAALSADAPMKISLYDLHQRLGHLSYGYIKRLMKDRAVQGFVLNPSQLEEVECDVCMRAKAVRKPIASERSSPRAEAFGDLMHMDVWGPAPVRTINHALYTLTILDDGTLFLVEPLMRTKDEAMQKYVAYQSRLKTQHGVTIKAVHSDRGGEFIGQEFKDFLESQGTVQKLTVHDTPEHNGAAERTHLSIMNIVRSLLIASGLPKFLWGEAQKHAVWLFNRTPHAGIGFKTL